MFDLNHIKSALTQVMTRDAGRLLGRWRRLTELGINAKPDQVAQLAADIATSQARRAERANSVPEIQVDASLPIAAKADEIASLIRAHQVLILAGETGSGKTTQLPRLCLVAGRGVAGLIGCTQPRRIAARSVARRVASELGTVVGGLVGFQVRFTEQVGEAALIKFMTDGILLAETQSDPWLSVYDTIILDEAHERSLNIDFLLGYLKRLLAKRHDLKLIVTSATIDTARFSEHFHNAPVVNVEGRSYPVEVRWRPPPERGEANMAEQIIAAMDEITQQDPLGDVLIFLPGEREIRDTHLALSRRKYRETEIVALYARLSAAEQDRVFQPGPQRRIVLATNVAETSLTVPRIRYVIDTGTARVKRYTPRSQLERLHIEPISQAAAEQRKGRCGRLGPGVCLRLYGEDDYINRSRFTDPEILRSSLAGVILRMLSLKLGDVEDFPFIEAPSDRAIGDGYRRLTELAAIDERHRLTEIGRSIAKLPVDVALGRMLVEAHRLGALRELLVLAAFLSIQDPRERPADARQAADQAHAQFVDAKSDVFGVLNLWTAYTLAHEELTQSKLRDWCQLRFLSYLRMREWRELHRQLLLITQELGWGIQHLPLPLAGEVDARSAIDEGGASWNATLIRPFRPPSRRREEFTKYEGIHRCMLSAWPTQVGLKDERGQYRGPRERRFGIFPGSALAKSPPRWVLAGQVLDLQKIYALMCARIEPEWIEQQAAHLIKRSWRDAHWSRKRGAVMAFEQITLFGMILVEKRTVQFGKQDPKLAHEIFVREALTRCDIDCKAEFVQANARVLEQAQELEAKQRRCGLLKDEEELIEFFAGKISNDINTSAALDAWYRRAKPAEQAAVRWSLDNVLAVIPDIHTQDFPVQIEFAGHALKLEYRFVPGDTADGVTLHIPLALMNAVVAARCDWLVPGLLSAKVAELIRGLPKTLRRNFVPAPDFARAFVEAEPACHQPLIEVLACYLKRVTGIGIGVADFASIELPAHMRMNFRIHKESGESEHGNVLGEGRDLAVLQMQWGDAARAAFSQRADTDLTREDIAWFDFEDIPDAVIGQDGLIAYPALVDLGDNVALRVFERADEALVTHVKGVARLLRRVLHDKIKQAQRQLPIKPAFALKYTAIAPVEALRQDIVEAALGELLAECELNLRQRETFRQVEDTLARNLFPTAIGWLTLVEDVLAAYAELTAWMQPPRGDYGRANYDDLHEQLAALIYPGFVQKTNKKYLSQYPRYLKAMRLRATRLRQEVIRDQARMFTVQSYWREYIKLKLECGNNDSALAELRWLIEEFRVSLFAQELKTPEPVSPKRLNRLLVELQAISKSN